MTHETHLERHDRAWRNWCVICTCGWRSRNVFFDEAQTEANRHKKLTK